MTAQIMPNPLHRFYNNDGTPLVGGKVYTYAAGTSTPKDTYVDSDGIVPNANPITLNANGEALIRWIGSYRVDVKTSAGLSITGYPVDNFSVPDATSAATELRAELGTASGADLIVTANGETLAQRLALTLTAADAGAGTVPVFAVGTPNPGVTSQFFASKAITGHANYGFIDNSTVTYSGPGFQAHASYNDNVTFSGSESSDHHHSYQAYPHYGSTGTVNRLSCFWAQPDVTAGVVTELSTFKANDPLGTGAITTLYGMYIAPMTRGTTNYGVYADGVMPSFFGGGLLLGQITNPATIKYNVSTGHLDIIPRDTFETRIQCRITRFGVDPGTTANLDNNGDGNFYINPRLGYEVRIGAKDLRIMEGAKGVIMSNAAGTVTRRVRLNDTGTALIFEAV